MAFVLAGGKGTRLYPLTKERAKPAVPFGGRYRIVDFVLSNLINSGIYSTYVLIQFKSQSLLQHLRDGWEVTGLLKEHFIIPVPAQMRSPGENWYRGTADAIYQNINLIEQADPHFVVIFGADHIYRMNIREMLEFHMHKRAQATIAAIPVPRDMAGEFGVIETAPDGAVVGFHEKNADAPTMPGDPERVYASMGNYIFSTNLLLQELYADAQNPEQLARFRPRHSAVAGRPRADVRLRFSDQSHPRRSAGAGALLARRRNHRRLLRRQHGSARGHAGAESVQPPVAAAHRRLLGPAGEIHFRSSRAAAGRPSIRSSPAARFFPEAWCAVPCWAASVRVHSGAVVEDSVIFDNCDIGRRARVRRAILDKNVRVPEDAEIGYDLERDRQRYFVTDSGIVVIEGTRSMVEVAFAACVMSAVRIQ